ncbi:CvpA family protein [Formosa sp. S-31]|uniref:CvpA family protein n=1 Tax=Formosa sp. S-31 TaxID=2790949 RepID=UPI003EB9A19B
MTTIDIILAVLLLFGLIKGFFNGLFVEIASLLSLIVGVYGAIHFSNFTASLFEDKVDWDEHYVNIVAFAITFIVIVLAIVLAGKAFTKLANFAALGIVNKLLGALFGGLKIAMILSIVLNIFDKMNNTIPFVDEEDMEKSMLYTPVKSLFTSIYPAFSEDLEEKKDEILDS